MISPSRADQICRDSVCVGNVPAKFLVNLPGGLITIRIVLGRDSFPIILDITGCDLRFVEKRINLFLRLEV